MTFEIYFLTRLNSKMNKLAIAVGLSQKVFLKHNRTNILNNMTQMLQVSKNSNIKYDIIQVKLN